MSKIVEGQKFGSFTVWFKGDVVGNDQYWVCKCVCGNIRFVNQYKLTKNRTTHCGCRKRQLYEDLKGYKFAKLLVLDYLYQYNIKHYWECLCECGNKTSVQSGLLKSPKGVKSCKCLRNRPQPKGKDSISWRGGKHTDKCGYVLVRVNGKYVQEHRLEMEKHIGRKLTPQETVHHLDGNRKNNSISNLELWTSNHPPGQRVSDLVMWAKELLLQYEPESLSINCKVLQNESV